MSQRPKTSETLLLAIELLKRIPRNHKVTAAELQQQLQDISIERDIRTIQRQLEMLSEHFDIERDDRNKPYGYRWKELASGFSLPMLTRQESLLLSLAEKQLKQLLPANIMRSMQSLFKQANYNIHSKQDKQLEQQWLKKVRVFSTTQPLLPPTINVGVFEAVSQALYSNHWLKLNYENRKKITREVLVMPLGLAQLGHNLYLVCRYKDYENERSLALHRIQQAEATQNRFQRPKGFDLEKYDNEGRFSFASGSQIKLSFRIHPEAGLHLYETPLSIDQTIHEQSDGWLEITATVADSARLDWWLRGFGDEVTDIRKEEKTIESELSQNG